MNDSQCCLFKINLKISFEQINKTSGKIKSKVFARVKTVITCTYPNTLRNTFWPTHSLPERVSSSHRCNCHAHSTTVTNPRSQSRNALPHLSTLSLFFDESIFIHYNSNKLFIVGIFIIHNLRIVFILLSLSLQLHSRLDISAFWIEIVAVGSAL